METVSLDLIIIQFCLAISYYVIETQLTVRGVDVVHVGGQDTYVNVTQPYTLRNRRLQMGRAPNPAC